MRLHLQGASWDLDLALRCAVVIATVLLARNVGNLLLTPIALFVPGYILVAALFPSSLTPKKPDLRGELMERSSAMASRYSWNSGVRGSVCVHDGCLRGG